MPKELILKLHEINAVKFGEFKLKSGIMSPIYIDLRVTVSYPQVLRMVADAMWEMVKNLKFDVLCGIPYTALPFATVMSVDHNVPMVLRRKEVKEYGTKKAIEGNFIAGQTCLVVDDMITNGASKFETIEPLEREGLKVTDLVILVDREQGGAKHLAEKDYNLYSVMSLSEILNVLEQEGKLSPELVQKTMEFIKATQM